MHNGAISASYLASLLEQYLADQPEALAVEDGEVLFDFGTAKYSVSGDGKCILHLWSEERNAVRRVLDAELKGQTLRLNVLRFGQAKSNLLEICVASERRTAASSRLRREQHQRVLSRVLLREYPGFKLEHLSNSPDLEHSLSPVYTRAVLRAGQSAFAVLGVNSEESQSSVDGASSPARAISPAASSPARRRYCSWLRPRCARIPRPMSCCATFLRELNGQWCRWTSAGVMACAW